MTEHYLLLRLKHNIIVIDYFDALVMNRVSELEFSSLTLKGTILTFNRGSKNIVNEGICIKNDEV